jgi:hypothetical protein
MPFNVYEMQVGCQNYIFYIEISTTTKEGEVESTGCAHSFESDQKDGNQYTARLHSTLRSYPVGHAMATIEEADLPKFHELCFAAIGLVLHRKYPSRPGVHTMMPSPWKQEPWEW